MSIPPLSPSSRQFMQQPSPTSPSYAEHKRTLLDDVKNWSEQKVTEWLSNQALGRFSQKFIEHNISGSVLLDVDYEALKAMDIKTVGERVRLLTAIKALRQECYLAASLAARIPARDNRGLLTPATDKHEGFNMTEANTKPSKSSETSSAKSLLNRSNSFSRFLGRSESKRSQRNASVATIQPANPSPTQQQTPPTNSDIYSLSPSSPKTLQKRISLEGGIMSMEKVKQTCVKVFGEDGQTRIVNVHTANESKQIMAKVLHKFGIDESNADSYCIFVGSSTNGEARALSDTELVEICRSVDRPEKERLILRKRHLYPTHEQFKRKGTINTSHRRPLYQWQQASASSIKDTLDSSRSRRRFFGERPPSEIISNNLHSFFPNHNREVLETAGIKAQRLSMTRRNSALSRFEPRTYRNSVLPELVSVLGVDLDKFLEEEEQEFVVSPSISSSSSSSSSSGDDGSGLSSDDDEGEEKKMVAEKQSIKIDTPVTTNVDKSNETEMTRNRTSSLPVKPLELENVPVIREPVGTPKPKLPDTWMKGSLIGRGTFGDVYLGLNPISGELMAVKQVELPVENSASEERKKSMIRSLRREIELLQDLEHENIVQYLGHKTDESYFSIFLEYVPGGSVAGLLSSYGAFQEPLVNSFVRQILKGLSYLHGKDIVHRDIKGANVLVDNKGGVKITDFGISKKVEEEMGTHAAHRPSLQGSIYWMAPEVVKQTHYTMKADIWSLGCMVVEMFTGDHPFPEYSQMQAIFQIGCYTSPNIPPNLSQEAQDFLKCTFQLNHEERPSAEELLKHPFLHESQEEELILEGTFSNEN
ncbi:kinase-like domain-containing protein [Gilbertella persicaria]|uniref:kinase-like domain-containing protein n=1 Tax=Gilbertella persicaria TaxID=101096 RepID=UPI002220F1C6|nr:kinase-like domain-containing protein [Gilbertella persicaria]KAI8071176.1 kinase-like domain-containing protein [Gilbertella persicaria]